MPQTDRQRYERAGRTDFHTDLDYEALRKAEIGVDSVQPRENYVRCPQPGCQALTWNLAGLCADHYRSPAQARMVRDS